MKIVEGKIRGIQAMIDEQRYCMDILSQIRAVTGAMRKIESWILASYLQHSANDAIISNNSKEAAVKIKEIKRLFEKMI